MKAYEVLVIEDELTQQELVKRLLLRDKDIVSGMSNASVDVKSATNWTDARKAICMSGVSFDLILFDLRFPDVLGPRTGLEPYQHQRLPEVRAAQPDAVIAIWTDFAYDLGLEICVDVVARHWADEFIPKDQEWSAMLKRINRAKEFKRLREMAARPFHISLARTATEDIQGCVADTMARLRSLVRGTDVEAEVDKETRALAAEIDRTAAYIINNGAQGPEPFLFAPLLADLRNMHQGQLGAEDDFEVHNRASVEGIHSFVADVEAAVKTVFQNAIDAVMEPMPAVREKRTPIRLTIEKEEDLVLFRIRDSGPGFSPQALDDLFAPHRTHWLGRKRGFRNGMGLYAARRRLYSVGGDIRIDRTGGETEVTAVVPEWATQQ